MRYVVYNCVNDNMFVILINKICPYALYLQFYIKQALSTDVTVIMRQHIIRYI